jgi:hypothetical protein
MITGMRIHHRLARRTFRPDRQADSRFLRRKNLGLQFFIHYSISIRPIGPKTNKHENHETENANRHVVRGTRLATVGCVSN